VFLQRPPGLGESIQAEDRAHRIGSEHHAHGVEFIDIVAENTVESRIRAMLRSKAGQLSEFVLDTRIVRELLGGIR
jgi:SNF2 family DNA or RNA helicase